MTARQAAAVQAEAARPAEMRKRAVCPAKAAGQTAKAAPAVRIRREIPRTGRSFPARVKAAVKEKRRKKEIHLPTGQRTVPRIRKTGRIIPEKKAEADQREKRMAPTRTRAAAPARPTDPMAPAVPMDLTARAAPAIRETAAPVPRMRTVPAAEAVPTVEAVLTAEAAPVTALIPAARETAVPAREAALTAEAVPPGAAAPTAEAAPAIQETAAPVLRMRAAPTAVRRLPAPSAIRPRAGLVWQRPTRPCARRLP